MSILKIKEFLKRWKLRHTLNGMIKLNVLLASDDQIGALRFHSRLEYLFYIENTRR